MATIEQRKAGSDTTYRVKIRLKGHPPQTATFERKTDARHWAQQTETAIREGRHFKTTEAKRHTLGELVDRYLRDVLPSKPKSEVDQKRQLLWWKQQLGHYVLADVTAVVIAEHRDKLTGSLTPQGRQRSPATANRYMAALSHALTIAVKEWGWLDDNPMRKVRKLKEPRGRLRFLTEDERPRLLEACKAHSPALYSIVVLALSTGARQGEILNLNWRDIDLARGMIVLEETKNNERRAIPLQGHALELIKEMSKVKRIDTGLLFPSRKDPSKPLNVHSIWRTTVKKAGIEDFRFHDLRHSCASYLAMNGASLAEIADVLGHKTLQMVKRYAHLSEQHTAGVVARMNKQIFG